MLLQEINQHLQATRDKLLTSLNGLSVDQFNKRKDQNSWSIGQVCQHLIKTEELYVYVIRKGLKSNEESLIEPKSLEFLLDRSKRLVAPDIARPTDDLLELPEIIVKLNNSRQKLNDTLNAVEDPSLLSKRHFIHPVFKEMLLIEWVRSLYLHEQRHIEQIIEINTDLARPILIQKDEELFDIFNEEMIKVGVETREDVHSRGLWHQTFHCWVLNNSKTEVLLQLRHKDKDTYPGLLDISCAGHLQSGETIENGVRELKEELGISASFEELTYCGMVAQENVMSNGLIDREFNHVFLFQCNKAAEDYNFQQDEISGLFLANINDFKKLLCGDIDSFWIDGIIIDEVDQQKRPDRRRVYGHDLTPNSSEYYDLLFDKMESVQ